MGGRAILTVLVRTWVPLSLHYWSMVIHSPGEWYMELRQVSLPCETTWILKVKLTFFHYSRFSAVTNQGIKNFTNAEATTMAVRNRFPCCFTSELDSIAFFFVGHKPWLWDSRSFRCYWIRRLSVLDCVYSGYECVYGWNIQMWVTVPQIRSWWYLINPRAADNVLDLTKGDEVDQNRFI